MKYVIKHKQTNNYYVSRTEWTSDLDGALLCDKKTAEAHVHILPEGTAEEDVEIIEVALKIVILTEHTVHGPTSQQGVFGLKSIYECMCVDNMLTLNTVEVWPMLRENFMYLQMSGWAIVLNADGTWFTEDTTGG